MRRTSASGKHVLGGRTIPDGDTAPVAIESDASQIISGIVTASNAAGDVAHNSPDSGNPVKVGGKAVDMDGSAPPGVVAQADRADFLTDLYGRQLVDTSHPNFWRVTAHYTSAQTDTQIKAAPAAGLSLYITDILISNGPVAGNVLLEEDTASAKTAIIQKLYFGINGGTGKPFQTPLKLTAAKNLGVTSVSCTDHSVTVSGYIAP